MKRGVCILFLLCLLINNLVAQTEANGIKWIEGLSWKQVKEKARKENKYIFVDAYATWCGPCKLMDKDVYTNDTVGTYFNDKFISVKVQMDKTNRDDENVKKWYTDAENIMKEYKVEAFPTYLFFSPGGAIVHKETGFKAVNSFIATAGVATVPGKIYENPYAEFDSLVKNYNQGLKNFARMPYMVETAIHLGEMELAKKILKDYYDYLPGLKEEELYTINNIKLLASLPMTAKSKYFYLFYPDASKIDSVMNNNGFASDVVNKVIQRDIVNPYLGITPGGWSNTGSAPINREINWKALYRNIREQYNAAYAKRNLLTAKVNWYNHIHNFNAFVKHYLLRLEKYGIDTSDLMENAKLNNYAWEIFMKVTNKKQLQTTSKWIKDLAIRTNWMSYIDTYANLLYKMGKKQEALKWEAKALGLAMEAKHDEDKYKVKVYQEVIEKMKRGMPTWTTAN